MGASLSERLLKLDVDCLVQELVRGSYSARVPRSSLAGVRREFVHHIVEEVDGQEERQDDKRQDRMIREKMDSKERQMEKSRRESEQKHERMRMTRDT